MPSAWRVHVISERLGAAGIPARVRESDIYGLEGAERHAVLDALVRGAEAYPMVVVDGAIACVGDLDLPAIVAAAGPHDVAPAVEGGARGGCCC